VTYKKKLIEVALPLEAINRESAREKSIRHGHPSTLHLWWARRPLAACRAVLFASLVDDPSAHPDRFPTEEAQQQERERLFRIIEDLVKWENSTNSEVLKAARAEIMASCDGNPPPVLDPFCGGGSIPLEAQRLGLEAHASDLNPVAVLITKALIEIPPKFAGRPPVHPDDGSSKELGSWEGARGLAEDVRYYGRWMRDEAERRIGHLYPKVKLPREHGGGEATVIAWIWARTVKSPNPAWDGPMPLVRSFALSTKQGKETWVQPIVDREHRRIRFEIRTGPGCPEGTVGRNGAVCLATGTPVPLSYIRAEGKSGRMGAQLMAIVAEGPRGRIYLPPNEEHERTAHKKLLTANVPDFELSKHPQYMAPPRYGLTRSRDLYTDRQLQMHCVFSALVVEARARILDHLEMQDRSSDSAQQKNIPFQDAYGNAVSIYLALTASKLCAFHNVLARWRAGEDKSAPAFGRQALGMVWDFAELNPFAGAGGDWFGLIKGCASALERLPAGAWAEVEQADAAIHHHEDLRAIICTDPLYYDNVPYADLSDFFYVWLRYTSQSIQPRLFGTLLTPKASELVADRQRFDTKEAAEKHFESGLAASLKQMRKMQLPAFPLTVYYAFRQTESEGGTAGNTRVSTGWETMLAGLLRERFLVNGTWPMRTEGSTRLRGMSSNALATSIVLVCRPRPEDAPLATRKDFLCERKKWPKEALAYNALVVSWPEILQLADEGPLRSSGQQTLV
jgi:putative DNA methylase